MMVTFRGRHQAGEPSGVLAGVAHTMHGSLTDGSAALCLAIIDCSQGP